MTADKAYILMQISKKGTWEVLWRQVKQSKEEKEYWEREIRKEVSGSDFWAKALREVREEGMQKTTGRASWAKEKETISGRTRVPVKSGRCACGERVEGAECEPKSESLTCFIYSRRILFRFISDQFSF